MILKTRLRKFILPKARFGLASIVATAVDQILYIILISHLIESKANFISYSVAMILNFILQKKFIFALKRKTQTAFLMSMFFSLIGLFFGTLLIHWFSQFSFFGNHRYLNKVVVTGIIFFYNFYTKRFAFEKTFSGL